MFDSTPTPPVSNPLSDPEHQIENSRALFKNEEIQFANNLDNNDNDEERKSRISFSSIGPPLHLSNSAHLTTFLLINTMIGSGILNQPYVFMKSGLIGGLIGFIIAG